MTSPDHSLADNWLADAATAATAPRRMQPLRALLGSIAVLAALPLAILTSVVCGAGDGIAVHAALGVGMVLLASSVFVPHARIHQLGRHGGDAGHGCNLFGAEGR